MKKNMVIMVAALCVVNGLLPTTIFNESPYTISVSGAFGKFYTLAPKGGVVYVSSLGRKVQRGDSLPFQAGVQDNLRIMLGSVNEKTGKFELPAGVTNQHVLDPMAPGGKVRVVFDYDFKKINHLGAKVQKVWFMKNKTLMVFVTKIPHYDLYMSILYDFCNPKSSREPVMDAGGRWQQLSSPRCKIFTKTGETGDPKLKAEADPRLKEGEILLTQFWAE